MWGWGEDGDNMHGDLVEMGKNFMGIGWDGDVTSSPMSLFALQYLVEYE